MKLDVELLRYLGGDEFRVLHAVEVGMRNHEYVPVRMLGTSTYPSMRSPHTSSVALQRLCCSHDRSALLIHASRAPTLLVQSPPPCCSIDMVIFFALQLLVFGAAGHTRFSKSWYDTSYSDTTIANVRHLCPVP